MVLRPFKGRTIDRTKLVQVYRNLNGDDFHRWSIRQGGLVVAHAHVVGLKDVEFRVSDAGWKRSLREKRRNVHAVAVGMLCEPIAKDVIWGERIRYNRSAGVFGSMRGFDVWSADTVTFVDQVWARGIGYEYHG